MICLVILLVLNPIPSSIQNLWLSVVVIVVVVVVVVLIANVHVNRNWYLSGSWSFDNFLLVNHALLQRYITVSWILGWVWQGLYPVWLISSYMARYSTIFDGCTSLPVCALLKGPSKNRWKTRLGLQCQTPLRSSPLTLATWHLTLILYYLSLTAYPYF